MGGSEGANVGLLWTGGMRLDGGLEKGSFHGWGDGEQVWKTMRLPQPTDQSTAFIFKNPRVHPRMIFFIKCSVGAIIIYLFRLFWALVIPH